MDGSSKVEIKTCAVYCRKSSEEGLEQEFNSLDAQHEACAAFIGSQRFEGWKLSPTRYEDGGKSGGNLERPALKQLIADIEAGHIQIVVVYKVDRLTRSLADFAKLVDVFDKHGVSFVSVTQQFNTTSSMGRLTLNVLLSFAQYEREVTAERIRDKIAASKKKGMWMGGVPPLGYEPNGRSLKIINREAEQVRCIFNLYLELGCVRALKAELEQRGIRSKRWLTKKGNHIGGNTISRGSLYKLLKNPIYIGHIRHGDQLHEGQHEAIIDQKLWQQVQDQLNKQTVTRKKRRQVQSPLSGLLFDENGNGFTPSHANKKGRRYRYYVNQAILQDRPQTAGSIHRISAPKIEGIVSNWLAGLLMDPQSIKAWTIEAGSSISTSDLSKYLTKAKDMSAQMIDGNTANFISSIIQKVTVTTDGLSVRYDRGQLLNIIGLTEANSAIHEVGIKVNLKKKHSEDKLVIASDFTRKDLPLIKMLVQAHGWVEMVRSGDARTIKDVARFNNLNEAYVHKHIKMALLAPDIQKAIIEGTQLAPLSLESLKTRGHDRCWDTQRKVLRF
ncbi:recombinase family protein [Kordiimonas aquimaris]|uniref:recombinase family protein n=1 Tax=Kordiimonas aquimaris TaxID=707591 RepID=UPI0021CFABF2|nr:recombinase family protein [Kordiimonas aquimaris]